jgi:P-type E1-E2 ATPase
VILVSIDRVPQLILSLEEAHLAKQESKEVVNYLRKVMKLRVAMITGDNKHSAYKVARHLGIDINDVVYKAYPEDKKKAVERF